MSSFGRKMWALPLMICLTLITVCTFGFAGCGEAVTYKVTFFANGGYFQDLEGTTEKDTKYTIEVKSGEKIDSEIIDNLKSKIKRESSNTLRFTFDGWDFDASTSIQEEMTINAKWTESTRKYTTEFVASGGKYTVGEEQKDSLEYSNEYNTNCAVPSDPIRDADNNYTYTFAGYLPAISAGTTSLVVTQDKTYTAQWNQVEQKYSITFNANGGYFGTATESTFTATDATYQQVLSTILNTNNKEPKYTATATHYYVFDGWYTEETGGDKITKVSDITTVSKDNKSATVYAHWNEREQLYKITFNAYQGQFTPTENPFVVEDAKYSDELASILNTAQKPNPTRLATNEKKYTFEGWYTDTNFTTKVTKISDIMDATKGTTYATVYANYTEADQEYSITFNANGGAFGESETEFTKSTAKYNDTLESILTTDSKTATKAEDIYYTYSLQGWYTAKTGGTKVTKISEIMDATQGKTTATVYASWSSTTKTYSVEFDGNGGKINGGNTLSVKMNSNNGMQYCVNQAKNMNRDPWTDENYEFSGWSTQQEGGSVLSKDDLGKNVAEFIIASDVTQTTLKLYAQWKVVGVRACDQDEPYIVSDLASFEAMIKKLDASYDAYSEESDATKKASILQSASKIYYQITANINLTNLKAPGKWFVGHLDAQATDSTNYKIWGMQAENFKSSEGAIFDKIYDATISNLNIGLTDKIVTFAMLGYGNNVEFSNVDIYGVNNQNGAVNKNATILISADDNNESAYISQSFASSLKFENCDNYANYKSESAYFGVFLGGYTNDYKDIRDNHPEQRYKNSLAFINCVNHGNITSSGSVGILTGNSWERNFTYSENADENTITITNCKNEGTIKAQSYGGFVGFARNDTANPTAGIYPDLNTTLSKKVDGMTDDLCSVLPNVTGTLSLTAENKYTLTDITGGVKQGYYKLTVVAFASSPEKGTVRLNYSTEVKISSTKTSTTSITFDRGKYDFIDSTSYSALPIQNSILDDSTVEWNEMTGYNIKYAFDDTNKYIVFDFTNFSYGAYTINSPSITVYLECYAYNSNNKLELTSVTKTNDSSNIAKLYGVSDETTLRQAVSDSKDYIFVTRDINVTGEYISINKDTYINLGGHTITANKGFDVAYGVSGNEDSKKALLYLYNGTLEATNFAVWVQNAGKLIIRNATVNTNSYAATIVIAGDSSSTSSDKDNDTKPTVVLGEGAIVSNTFSGKSLIDPNDESKGYTNTATITVHDGGQLALLEGSTVRYIGENQEAIAVQVDNATINSLEGSLIYSNAYGVVVVNGTIADIEGKIYSRHYAISTDERENCGNVTIEITDGAEVISTRSAAVYMSNSGNLNISGGHIEGATALYIKSGTTEITGGNFTAWYGELLEFYHKDFGCKSTGDVIVIEACGCAGGAPTVTIGDSTDKLTKIQFTHYAKEAINVRYIQYNNSTIGTVTVEGVAYASTAEMPKTTTSTSDGE